MKSVFSRIASKFSFFMLMPAVCYADVGQMMNNLQTAILTVVAPVLCVLGVVYSGIKLAMGDESAKKMLFWSCVGTVVTFTAPSIMTYLRTSVAA